jgi:ectoine hydroxylase-related dioxygenase (phytanoyl-CoA dioxygenase family)
MAGLNTFSADAGIDEIADSIREHSYAIVHDVLDAGALARLRGELTPHLDTTHTGKEAFTGFRTKRFGSLLARVPMSRELVLHPTVKGVAENLLRPSCARIQLNYTGIMHLEPGEKAQTLHRDTGFYPLQNPCPPLILATMWAISDFSRENGATCFVPGSHLWDDKRQPRPDEIVAAEMPAGSVLMYIGATVHGGGANRANAARTGMAIHYTLGWLRQEENQYLAVPQDMARSFPPELQELMGYGLGTVNLGFVDHKDPGEFLNGTAGEGPGNLGPAHLMDADNAIARFHVDGAAVVGRARYDIKAAFSEDT